MAKCLCYQSPYTLSECINQITKEPHQYECKWGTPLWYKVHKISDTQLLITFTGGQFRKMMRTEYLMELSKQDNCTQIVLCFQNEMLGLPPMTSPSDIDLFMNQKLKGHRT